MLIKRLRDFKGASLPAFESKNIIHLIYQVTLQEHLFKCRITLWVKARHPKSSLC